MVVSSWLPPMPVASLKVMSIRLRGVELPPHSSEFPVVIAAVTSENTKPRGLVAYGAF